MNELISNGGDCRTAPATWGLLIITGGWLTLIIQIINEPALYLNILLSLYYLINSSCQQNTKYSLLFSHQKVCMSLIYQYLFISLKIDLIHIYNLFYYIYILPKSVRSTNLFWNNDIAPYMNLVWAIKVYQAYGTCGSIWLRKGKW